MKLGSLHVGAAYVSTVFLKLEICLLFFTQVLDMVFIHASSSQMSLQTLLDKVSS